MNAAMKDITFVFVSEMEDVARKPLEMCLISIYLLKLLHCAFRVCFFWSILFTYHLFLAFRLSN